MSKIKFVIDQRMVKKDGTSAIRAFLGNGTRMYLPTGVSVPQECFADGRVLKTYKGHRAINALLDNLACRIDSRMLEIKTAGLWFKFSADPEKLKAALTDFDTKLEFILCPPPTLCGLFQEYMALKKGPTRRLYEDTERVLRLVMPDYDKITPEDITASSLKRLENTLRVRGLAVNTISIHMRNLRAVFNYALDEERIRNYPFRKYSIPREETRHRNLDINTLRQIYNLELSGPFEEARLTFLLMFYLIGVNVSDLWEGAEIFNGRLEYRRHKTGKTYSIKLEPEALEILEKLGQGKSHFIAPMDRYGSLHEYTKYLNNYLKRLGPYNGEKQNGYPQTTPINPELTTYWTRHSWASIASEIGVDISTISLALGHSIGSKITSVYIAPLRSKIDVANRAVIDYLKDKKNRQTVTA